MLIINNIYVIFIFSILAHELEKKIDIDPTRGRILINSFISNINEYCQNNYDLEISNSILLELCENQQIDVTSDIPSSSYGLQKTIVRYLQILRDSSIIIEYSKDFFITKCYLERETIWGCQISKTIKYRKNNIKSLEFIEIVDVNGSYRIASINSDILNPLEVKCENMGNTMNNKSCELMDIAESEFEQNKIELAISHYEQAKECKDDASILLSEMVQKVNLDSIYKSSFQKGNLLFSQGKYEEASVYYQSIKLAYKTIPIDFASNLDKQILKCELEIKHMTIINLADYYYNQGFYDKALIEYTNALSIKHLSSTLSRIDFCKEKIQEFYIRNAQNEINKAERLITKFNFDEGFSILMKYRYSGLLKGIHFFHMAQIANSPSRQTIKEFNLTSRKRCLLTRQFMINAKDLGYRSEGFTIFWNEHLTKTDRSCD